MNKHVIFLVLLVNATHVWTSPHLVHLMNKREVFCGQKLSDALALVCKGNYNSPSKKSLNDILGYDQYDDIFPPETDDETQFDFPFLQKESASSFLPIRFRRRGGIVDECCRKPCSYKHLSLYCA